MADTAPQAAYPVDIEIAPDSSGSAGSYAPLGGDNKADFGPKQTLVDSTYFGGDGSVNRTGTLFDVDITVSGHFAGSTSGSTWSDDSAQNTLLASQFAADRYVWVKMLWSGSSGHGFTVKALVESAKVTTAVAGVIEFTATIKGSAKPTLV